MSRDSFAPHSAFAVNSPDAEHWRRIEEVVDRVLDADEAERVQILDEATTGDPALRREVEALLAASEAAGARFDVPPLLVARDAIEHGGDLDRDRVTPGDIVGAWRIERLLGRGGMGAVYQASRADGAFQKNVALKIVKRGMDTDEILRRFQHERHILARLEHPHIAGLLNGGVTRDGLPFIVMELAEGEPIDQWCDEHTLTIRERLRFFQTVCQAVQYAHSNLVIHRDLKPGNIVVANGEVKLLDFGIAKVLGTEDAPAAITQVHEARLTPQYAAPEQIRAQVTTTATDVYALGIVLYEMLCGRLPYDLTGRTLLEMEQVICNEEPVPPSAAVARTRDERTEAIARSRGLVRQESLVQALRGDLDAICHRALSKNPEDRYVSAIALAEDIERHLDGRPVRAHPLSRGYKVRKFVRRNRAMVVLATVLGLVLVSSTAVTSYLASVARSQSRERQAEATRAAAARDFMVSTLGGFDPDVNPAARSFNADSVVNRGRENLRPLQDQPRLEAAAMNTLGQVAFNLGKRTVADSLFRQAYAILLPLSESLDMAVSMMGIGQVAQRDEKFEEAADWFRRALDIRSHLLEPGDRLTAESKRSLAFVLYNLSTAGKRGVDSVAERLYQEMLRQPNLPIDLKAGALEGLADLRLDGRDEQADSLYQAVIELRIRAQGPDAPAVARTRWGRATALLRLRRPAEAETEARTALAILQRAYGTEHRNVAIAYSFLGQVLTDQGRLREAESEFVKAAETSGRVNDPGHSFTAWAWTQVGDLRLRQHNSRGAEQALRLALDTYRVGEQQSGKPERNHDAGYTEVLLAEALLQREQTRNAVGHFRAAIDLFAASDSARRSEAATRLASVYDKLGRRDSAEFYRAQAVR